MENYELISYFLIGDETINIVRKENMLYAGIVCNAGFAPYYEHEIDNMLSLDENLQDFYEELEKENNVE